MSAAQRLAEAAGRDRYRGAARQMPAKYFDTVTVPLK